MDKKLKWIRTTPQLVVSNRNSREHSGMPARYPMGRWGKTKLSLTFIVHELSYSIFYMAHQDQFSRLKFSDE